MSTLLEGFTVLDFSLRLPGPLAGKILSDQGARVIKIEDERFKDPFITGLFPEMDDSFPDWYKELNQKKEVMRFDFSLVEDQKKILKLALEADAIIMGMPIKVQEKLGITKQVLETKLGPLAIVELQASKDGKQSLHDLNALAEAGLLSHHVANTDGKRVAPPFFPVAGIAFGQQAANDILAALLKSQKLGAPVFATSYLSESVTNTFESFYSKTQRNKGRSKFLHNGLYPCYNIYRTQDGKYVALAAVEEKFWIRFCELFELNIPSEKRFHHQTDEVFHSLEQMFGSLDASFIAKQINQQECCLSLID